MINDLKIAHINIQATGQILTKPQTLINSLYKQHTDLICITEAKINNNNANYYIHNQYITHINRAPNNSSKDGVVTLIHKNLQPHITAHRTIEAGTATEIELTIAERTMRIMCIYAPSQGDDIAGPFFERTIFNRDWNSEQDNLIIGDFNLIQDVNLDRSNANTKYYKMKTLNALKNFKLENSMIDPWRMSFPDKHEYSWSNKNSSSRIDYTLTTANTYHLIQNIEYFTPPIDTDHKGVRLTINFEKFNRGKGYYKVNNELYTDPGFLEKINTMIDLTLDEHQESEAASTLDLILFNTCDIARKHTNQCREEQTNNDRYLITEIKTIEMQLNALIDNQPLTEGNMNYKNRLQNRLKKFENQHKEAQKNTYQESYLERIKKELTAAHKPAKDFKKPVHSRMTNLSEIFLKEEDPSSLT